MTHIENITEEEAKAILREQVKYLDTIKELFDYCLLNDHIEATQDFNHWFLVYNRKLIETIREDLKSELLNEILQEKLNINNNSKKAISKV